MTIAFGGQLRLFVFAIIMVAFFGALRAQAAGTILISDIDDTVRQTNSRNLGSMTILKNMEFAGMAKLYSQTRSQFSEIDYVTGNPLPLQKMVEYFLISNQFPNGMIYARDTQYDTVTHKVKAIEGLIAQKNPNQLVMIGDNGEQDPVSYKMIADKHSDLSSTIFIHQLYNDPVNAPQIPWLTSIDLTAQFFSRGWASEKDLDDILNLALPKLLLNTLEREKVFPAWGECREFFKNYSLPQANYSQSQLEKLQKYEEFLRKRCS